MRISEKKEGFQIEYFMDIIKKCYSIYIQHKIGVSTVY